MPCIAVGNGKVILPPELVRREGRFRCLLQDVCMLHDCKATHRPNINTLRWFVLLPPPNAAVQCKIAPGQVRPQLPGK